MNDSKIALRGVDGERKEATISLADYKKAAEANLSLPQYLNRKLGTETDSGKYGTPFEQAMACSGMFLSHNKDYGIAPPSVADLLDGNASIEMNAITRPDGDNALTPSGRMLFPAVIIEMIESELREDNSSYLGAMERMVATTVSVATPRYDQPVIDMTRPRQSQSRPIGQLAEPDRMLSITLSETSKRMPTYSIGIEISDEAQRASTLDLVGIAIREQAMQERADRADADLKAIIMGDVDSGQTALTGNLITAYDSSIAANMTMTQKAWVKYLRSEWKRRNIDWIICDLDTYLAIEGRSGRPIWQNQNPTNDDRLNSLMVAANPGLEDQVNFFIVDDSTITGGAGSFVGLDSRRAIRRVIYTGAQYEAIENFVLRRATAMRMDWSERHERLGYDNAFQKTSLATA